MLKKVFKSIDYGLIIIAIILFSIGITALYSANGGVNGNTEEVSKQLIWFGAGIISMILIIFIDYDLLRKTLDTNLYNNNIKFSWSPLYSTYKWSYKLVYYREYEYTTTEKLLK